MTKQSKLTPTYSNRGWLRLFVSSQARERLININTNPRTSFAATWTGKQTLKRIMKASLPQKFHKWKWITKWQVRLPLVSPSPSFRFVLLCMTSAVGRMDTPIPHLYKNGIFFIEKYNINKAIIHKYCIYTSCLRIPTPTRWTYSYHLLQ